MMQTERKLIFMKKYEGRWMTEEDGNWKLGNEKCKL